MPSSSGGGGAGIGAAPAAGGIFSKAGLAGMLPGLKSFFGFGENNWTNMGGGRMATGGWISQYGSFGDKLQALGKSNAALMAGGLLAMDGLRRGGYAGLAETTAGGALIGYKFGGPMGAAIGAAAGAVAGIVRLFVKGAVEKAKDKIKALYGVDISDKGVLQQIVDMAKSGFGGNLDMAIRSPQIRDLIQLYAMSTGQKTTGMPGTVTPLSLVETGGSLFQSPQYNNGTPLPGLGGLPRTRQDRRRHALRWWPRNSIGRPRHDRATPRSSGTGHRGQPSIGPERDDGRDQIEREPARAHQSSVESRNDCQLRCPAQF